jgi:hypothetical protein
MASSLTDRLSVRLLLMDTNVQNGGPQNWPLLSPIRKLHPAWRPLDSTTAVPLLHSPKNSSLLSVSLSISLLSLSHFLFFIDPVMRYVYIGFSYTITSSLGAAAFAFSKKNGKLCALLLLPTPRGAAAWNLFQIVMPFDVTLLKECVPSERHTL